MFIKEVKPELFNKVALKEVVIKDQKNNIVLNANKISANINLTELFNRRLIINTVQLFSFEGQIYRDSLNSPSNIDFIINRLKPKKKTNKGLIEIQLRTILIRRGQISYDVFSENNTPGKFNPNHIELSNLLASVSIKTISKDSINADVKRLSFNEKSGFELRKFACSITGNKKKVEIPKLLINLPHSSLNLKELCINMDQDLQLCNRKSLFKFDKTNQKQLLTNTRLNCVIESSFINTTDISPIIPALKDLPTTAALEAKISGTADRVNIQDMTINARELFFIKGHASFDKLFSSDDPYLFAEITKLYAAPEFTEMILNHFLPKNNPYRNISEENGFTNATLAISGFKSDLTGNIHFKSNLGEIDLRTNIKKNQLSNSWNFSGQLNADNLRVASLIKNKNSHLFGNANCWFDFIGNYELDSKPAISLNGEIFDFDFKGYRYNNLRLGAKLDKKEFRANLSMNDLNGYIQANVNLKNRNTNQMSIATDIELDGFNTDGLLLTNAQKNTSFSGKLKSNLSGKDLNVMSGIIQIDSLKIENNSDSVFIDQFSIQANQQEKYKQIRITSPLLNGEIRGNYTLSTLANDLSRIVAKEIPALFPHNKNNLANKTQNHVVYSLETGNLNPLFRIFSLNIDIPKPITLNGFMDNATDQFNLSLIAPHCKIGKNSIDQGQLYIHNENKNQIVEFKATTFNKKRIPSSLNLLITAFDDSITTNLQVYNAGEKTFGGEIQLHSYLSRNENNQLSGRINVQPTNLIINDTIWSIDPALIRIINNKVLVNNFKIHHKDQHIKIGGIASQNDNDSLLLQLNSINLDYIFELINVANVHFGGYASGDFSLSKFHKIPHISTNNFTVKNFSFNGAHLGNLNLHSKWDQTNSGILMKGSIKEKTNESFVDGYIFPTKDSIDLQFDAAHLNIAFINQFVSSIFSKFEGKATGDVRLFGKFSKLALDGSAQLEDIKLGVGYTNTEYIINDRLYLKPERIYFENITLTDSKGNKGKASGELKHKGFKNIQYDIALYPEKMLVFDTNSKLNNLFFGTIFATGKGTIKGDESNVFIAMNGKSEANSNFTFSLSNSATANEYKFLTFVNRSDSPNKKANKTSIETDTSTKSAMINIDLQMDVNPDAKLSLIMDETTGDQIQTTGSGSLRLNFNTKDDDVKLYGTYTIEKGNYFFNLQNLFVREFLIENGSSVIFRGDPLAAELNINAIYALTANLTDLDESFSTDKELSRTNVPVQCQLNITGEMLQPELDFNIGLPSNSDDINRKVKSIIGTPEMMNQQIIYLLLLNKFYTPDYLNVGQRNELSAIASSTISSQLNNILRQVSSNWNLGTNIRSDKGDFSDIEVELALSSQLLNNRLLINGNFGYKDNPKSQTNFIGDIDAEYKLSKSGNLLLKGYNKTNDRYYYIKSAVTTQGLGLIYKKDFDKIFDLFNSRKLKNKKKKVRSEEQPPTAD